MKKPKKQTLTKRKYYILFIALLIISVGGVAGFNLVKKAQQNEKLAEAKTSAEQYFETVKNCDLYKANSYRFLPQNVDDNKNDYQKECPGGFSYNFVKNSSYEIKRESGEYLESAGFVYSIDCDGQTRTVVIVMTRSSPDDNWWVLSTL